MTSRFQPLPHLDLQRLAVAEQLCPACSARAKSAPAHWASPTPSITCCSPSVPTPVSHPASATSPVNWACASTAPPSSSTTPVPPVTCTELRTPVRAPW